MLLGVVEDSKTMNVDLVESSLLGYTEGFKKVMRQALHFSPLIGVNNCDLNKDVVDGHLVDEYLK